MVSVSLKCSQFGAFSGCKLSAFSDVQNSISCQFAKDLTDELAKSRLRCKELIFPAFRRVSFDFGDNHVLNQLMGTKDGQLVVGPEGALYSIENFNVIVKAVAIKNLSLYDFHSLLLAAWTGKRIVASCTEKAAASRPSFVAIQSSVPSKEVFSVSVKTLDGKTLTIDGVSSTSTIDDLKLKIQDQKRIPADQQRLIYAGRKLEGSHTVDRYCIRSDAVLFLTLCLRGGMYHITSGRDGNTPLLQIDGFRLLSIEGGSVVHSISLHRQGISASELRTLIEPMAKFTHKHYKHSLLQQQPKAVTVVTAVTAAEDAAAAEVAAKAAVDANVAADGDAFRNNEKIISKEVLSSLSSFPAEVEVATEASAVSASGADSRGKRKRITAGGGKRKRK